MSDNDPSIRHEPHLKHQDFERDVSESKAASDLAARRDAIDETHLHSVHDELAVFPHSAGTHIDVDWSCTACGYNLRGLVVGMPCPECGQVELYAPPPPDAPSYAWWLREKQRHYPPARAWKVILAATLVGGPLAVFGAMFNAGGIGLIAPVVYAPTVEEIVKIAAAVLLIETRPYIVRSASQIWIMTLGSAALFAIIENLLYLHVYLNNPTAEIIGWRWTVCTVLHIGCTAIATRGVLASWRQCTQEFRRPRLSNHVKPILLAIIIHGAYNFTAFMLEFTGFLF